MELHVALDSSEEERELLHVQSKEHRCELRIHSGECVAAQGAVGLAEVM
jgi:hypothetical protein